MIRLAMTVAILVAGAACATKPAPEYGGRWKAVNRYTEMPQEIPLQQAYLFHPSPMDGTLRSMLERWARDSKMALAYLHSSDFTLHSAVAQVRTNDLSEAAAQVSSAYAAQGIAVGVEGNRIVVRGAVAANTGTPATQAVASP